MTIFVVVVGGDAVVVAVEIRVVDDSLVVDKKDYRDCLENARHR